MLLITCIDNIMKQVNQEENGIEELMFADDLVLIAEDHGRLLEMVSTLDQQCKTLWYERQDKSDGHQQRTNSV